MRISRNHAYEWLLYATIATWQKVRLNIRLTSKLLDHFNEIKWYISLIATPQTKWVSQTLKPRE